MWKRVRVASAVICSQLLLLGMMLDKAEVTIDEDKVYLKLYKEMMV